MTKQVFVRALILMSALLVLNGCKDSETAKDAKKGDPALVLDAGQEPREPLRYKIAHGTTTSATMDFGIASLATTERGAALAVTPGVRLHIMSGPSLEGKRGSTRFDVRITKAEAIVPEGVDPAVAQDLNKSASVLNNVGGWVEVDDRGIIQRTELNEACQARRCPSAFARDDHQRAHFARSRDPSGGARRSRSSLGSAKGARPVRLRGDPGRHLHTGRKGRRRAQDQRTDSTERASSDRDLRRRRSRALRRVVQDERCGRRDCQPQCARDQCFRKR